jgi:hypothetical protein
MPIFWKLCRYVELNPVRARVVETAACWEWSSHRTHVGMSPPCDWLDCDAIHGFLLGRDVNGAEDRRDAQARYVALVATARDANLWDEALRQQIYLGDDAFIERMQISASPGSLNDNEILLAHRSKPRPLAHWLANSAIREQALRQAHLGERNEHVGDHRRIASIGLARQPPDRPRRGPESMSCPSINRASTAERRKKQI